MTWDGMISPETLPDEDKESVTAIGSTTHGILGAASVTPLAPIAAICETTFAVASVGAFVVGVLAPEDSKLEEAAQACHLLFGAAIVG